MSRTVYNFRVLLIVALLFFFPFKPLLASSEIYFKEETDEFIIKNDLFIRVLKIDKANFSFYTTSFKNLTSGYELCRKNSKEFDFKVNGSKISGSPVAKMLVYKTHGISTGTNGSKRLKVVLNGKAGSAAKDIEITLHYEIYDDLPTVRKWISIKNLSSQDIELTDLAWESINIEIGSPSWIPQIASFADVYAKYGQSVHKPPYIGRTDDAAILVFDPIQEEGFIVGNEGPSILKRSGIYEDSTQISIGMSYSKEDFPFKKYIKPNELFTSPKGFIQLYKGKIWQDAFEGDLATFVRKYMDVVLFRRKQNPIFLYNTWNPFMTGVNEKLINELAEVNAQCGVEYLIIDDGWQDTYGDWNVDKKKFPKGLKPVCDNIIKKGMKPGLWISLATVTDSSNIYKKHPEWVVKGIDGKHANLHAATPTNCLTMNLSTPYYDYIKEKIIHYVRTCNLGYIKLDLAAAYSSYKLNNIEVGDYATGSGRTHRDREESIYLLYSKIYGMFDELKAMFPDLYIDCTFELYGEIFGIDYSLIQHADGDWLSNIGDPAVKGALYMRQLCFERARVVPSSTMLIGNLQMNWDRSDLCFQSLLSSTNLMLGDPRTLSKEKIQWYKTWSTWAKEMEKKYSYTRFYQTSDIFTKPEYRGWDGCARFNKEKDGGILCFYRNESPETERTFLIPWVNESSNYTLYSAKQQREIGTYKGSQLKNKGVKISISDPNSAEIIGIEPVVTK